MFQISVIVCTFNRGHLLGDFLRRLEAQVVNSGLEAELIIVDNNSTDSTRRVISERQARSSVCIKAVYEARPGANHARNTGIRNATAELIVFTDDDVDFSDNWLKDYAHYMGDNPECQVSSGEVVPRFLEGRPEWLIEPMLDIFGKFYFGPDPVDLRFPDFPVEMNMAIRSAVFARHGDFHPAIGRSAKTLMSNDAKIFFHALARANEVVRYIPCARIFHLIPPERVTETFVLRRNFWQGVSDAFADELIGARSRASSFFASLGEGIRFANRLRGGHLSPKRILWHWHGMSMAGKASYARKAGNLARRLGVR